MGLPFLIARGISALSTGGLKYIFHRPAANFPGKIALYVDDHLIVHLRPRLKKGSVVVVGTNGKTTITNLIADVLEQAGQRVVCNRTGANLDSGVATSLLHAKQADWGVFETDELWLAKVLPQLKANYVVLVNLFRDQLDRVGEIDYLQKSIVSALSASPETVLVYNADDPLCTIIAERVNNPCFAFGLAETMGLAQNSVVDASMCQRCSSMLVYTFRQYGQLGDYHCPACGFTRPAVDALVEKVCVGQEGMRFTISFLDSLNDPSCKVNSKGHKKDYQQPFDACKGLAASNDVPHTFASTDCQEAKKGHEKAKPLSISHQPMARGTTLHLEGSFTAAYMVYNLAAVGIASALLHCTEEAIQEAITSFKPQNGRLQTYEIKKRRVLLNLAKNPTGFNQTISIVTKDKKPQAVAFFVNDKQADGRDVSWLWDIDFEHLADLSPIRVFAGGSRKHDVQVRLKYAGIQAELISSAQEVFSYLEDTPQTSSVYFIANYTALPSVQDDLQKLSVAVDEKAQQSSLALEVRQTQSTVQVHPSPLTSQPLTTSATKASQSLFPSGNENPIVIAHMLPDLLNLYGDGGNVSILEHRLRMRGIPVEVRRIHHGESLCFADVDLVFLGGGPDREQRLASEQLMGIKDDLTTYVNSGGAVLGICGGYQILGREWLLGDEIVEGLGIVPMVTRRAEPLAPRLIDNIVLQVPFIDSCVVGYENHAGRTYLDEGVMAFGQVISSSGHGNNDHDKHDGVCWKQVIGTYLHGPLLAKNPAVADHLLRAALKHHALRIQSEVFELEALDDSMEEAARKNMCKVLGVNS